jgi:exopolyphosphatase/guanosine-5'-triphosphate,3'-diphosphate pyrophosphatase
MSERDVPERKINGELAAAIDLGTNTVLCLVGSRGEDGALVVLEDRARMPRLGEGLAQRGTLAPAAVERTLEVLETHVRRLDMLGVSDARRRAVATAVLRRASDAAEFVRRAYERTGLTVEIVAPEDEASLGHAAVSGEHGAGAILVDVGGGSTEVAWDGGRSRASVPVGAVVLYDVHGDDTDAAIAAARAACGGLPADVAGEGAHPVILIGGTAVNLGCLVQELPGFDVECADRGGVSAGAALRWARQLGRLPPRERCVLPIEASRADLLPAGLACLGAALERLGVEEARVSTRGLRHGLLARILA